MPNRLQLTSTSTPAPPRLPAGALRVRGRIAEAMLAAHALAPEDAIEFAPDPRDGAEFAKLRAAGIVREVPGGRYWFDLVAYHLREQARSRVAVMWTLGLAVMIAAVAVLFYRG
ncbi:hypothetical protein FPZ24_02795 [Sphingomonas panacisoli]|uniref:Uncharacterized protein n=1 Tax=Sphingomonas panacisoli TaxID=1813879 RepID=A0A5B8LH96_9SPHN|nr:hypothetical protein [Sphingomonas panacisoli]QDZ06530.1 hypothetical protein FPZ24_02795 [Sphingomonas panacisoli]